MKTRLAFVVFVLAALATAPAAGAGGPGPYAQQGGPGVVAHGLRFVAVGTSNQDTVLESIRTSDGEIAGTADILGSWGIPALTPGGAGDSLSQDGKTLVLADTAGNTPGHFLVYRLPGMRLVDWVVLKGTFSFDALSPDGTRMYLVQYTQADLSHYIVRAYDLKKDRLLPGRIADRTQKSWIMNGYPLTRTASSDGRWVYTLYQNGGDGYPFVHALDTVGGVAHCIGIPLANQTGVFNLALSLHGRTLSVHWRSGRPFVDVNTATWRVSPAHPRFPWSWVLAAVSLLTCVSITFSWWARGRWAEASRRWWPRRAGASRSSTAPPAPSSAASAR